MITCLIIVELITVLLFIVFNDSTCFLILSSVSISSIVTSSILSFVLSSINQLSSLICSITIVQTLIYSHIHLIANSLICLFTHLFSHLSIIFCFISSTITVYDLLIGFDVMGCRLNYSQNVGLLVRMFFSLIIMMVILIFAVLLLVALLWIIVVINLSFTFYYCLENLYDLLLFSDQDTYFFHRLLMHFCSLIKIIFHFILMTFLFLS